MVIVFNQSDELGSFNHGNLNEEWVRQLQHAGSQWDFEPHKVKEIGVQRGKKGVWALYLEYCTKDYQEVVLHLERISSLQEQKSTLWVSNFD